MQKAKRRGQAGYGRKSPREGRDHAGPKNCFSNARLTVVVSEQGSRLGIVDRIYL
jgi:hypothetical protein